MSQFTVVRFFSNIWDALVAASTRRKIASRSQDLGTYFCSTQKPPVVSGRSFELFHRSRLVWNLMQVLFFVALAVWTLKNYMAVIKSL